MYLFDENEKIVIFHTKVDFNDLWWINGSLWYKFNQIWFFGQSGSLWDINHLVGTSTQRGPNLSRTPPPPKWPSLEGRESTPQYRFRIYLSAFFLQFDINFYCYDSQLCVIQYRLKPSQFFRGFSCFSKSTKMVNGLAIKKWLSLSLYWITPSWES